MEAAGGCSDDPPWRPRLTANALARQNELALMTVFELFYPGTRIELEDRAVGFEVLKYLSTIESRFTDAAVLLGLFEEAQAKASADLRSHIEQVPGPGESDAVGQPQFEPEMDARTFLREWTKQQVEAKRQRWQGGEPPRAYTSRLPFIYARAFLFSLWDVGKLLSKIGKFQGISNGSRKAIDAFDAAFPTLKGLRDSSAHLEERIAFQAHGRPIPLKPIDNTLVRAPGGGVLVVESLLGNKFVGTNADGELAEIEVSANTMGTVQECVQQLLNSLPWSGPSKHYPE